MTVPIDSSIQGDPADQSNPLASAIGPGQPTQQAPQATAPAVSAATPAPTPAKPTSRLSAILGAVASVVDTGLAGIPDKGRPSFVTGLGEGARSAKAAEATQQAIKFRTFDDQVRMAELHNQDQKMQNDNQTQQDAHTAAELHMRSMANDLGVDYDTIPNHGSAVMDHLTAQTAANGSASVPPGTHVSADGDTIYMPSNADSQKTQDGQKQMYQSLAPALGLPPLPQGAQFVPNKNLNMLTNKVNGFGLDGSTPKHDDLPALISNAKIQRENLSKNGGSANQLKTLDNMVGIYQANLDALDKHAASVADDAAQRKTDQQKQLIDEKGEQTRQTNATKPQKPQKTDTQMYVGSDATGNQIAGTASDLQTAGANGVTKLDADTGKKVVTARQLISPSGLFSLIRQDMDNLNAKGKLGSSATARFNDALLQKAGSDPDYAPLFVHTHLLSTALMQAHVGSRGSSDMMSEFQKLADAGKMNADTLKGALGAEFNYVHEKAMLPKKQQPTGGQ